jgi:hypothetical protein
MSKVKLELVKITVEPPAVEGDPVVITKTAICGVVTDDGDAYRRQRVLRRYLAETEDSMITQPGLDQAPISLADNGVYAIHTIDYVGTGVIGEVIGSNRFTPSAVVKRFITMAL